MCACNIPQLEVAPSTRTHSQRAAALADPHGKQLSELPLPGQTDRRPFSQPDGRQLGLGERERGTADCSRETAEMVPGVLCSERPALTFVTCDETDCWGFPQESEGFGDRLFLKQRMSLLSQMTSTPIDCLFKVRQREVFLRDEHPIFRPLAPLQNPQGGLRSYTLKCTLCPEWAVGVLRFYRWNQHARSSAQHVQCGNPLPTVLLSPRSKTACPRAAQWHLTGGPRRADASPQLQEPRVTGVCVLMHWAGSPLPGAGLIVWQHGHGSLLRSDRPLGGCGGALLGGQRGLGEADLPERAPGARMVSVEAQSASWDSVLPRTGSPWVSPARWVVEEVSHQLKLFPPPQAKARSDTRGQDQGLF